MRNLPKLPLLLLLAASPALAQGTPSLSPADFEKLTSALNGEPQRPLKVRLQAAIILGRVGGPEAVDALIQALEEDPEYPVRGASALALGTIGEIRAVEPLVATLDDTECFVREEAKKSLLKLARPEALPYLQAARERGSARVRLGLVDVVSQMKSADAAMLLLELSADPEEPVRVRAENELTRVASSALTPVLTLGLKHPNYRVRTRSAAMLGERQVAAAAGQLADLTLASAEPTEVQKAARKALEQMKGALDAQKLISTVRASNAESDERVRSLVQLSAVGGPDALQVCLDVLGDTEPQLRSSAAVALAELGDPRALPRLREALAKAENAPIARSIESAIQKLERGW